MLSQFSGNLTPWNNPYAPTIGTATETAYSTATVSFTDPANSTTYPPVTGYTVTSTPSGGVDTNAGTLSTSHNITGLTGVGTNYTFTVHATNSIANGPESAASNSIICASLPGAPTGVSATSGGDQVSTVTFTAPANLGLPALTGYTVFSVPAGAVDTNAGATSTSHLMTHLTNGTLYTFYVYATNSLGNSANSSGYSAIPQNSSPQVFTTTGAHSFVVPANIYTISNMEAIGGGSYGQTYYGGGGGGYARNSSMSVTPGSTIYINVGGSGASSWVNIHSNSLPSSLSDGIVAYASGGQAGGTGFGQVTYTGGSGDSGNSVTPTGGGGGGAAGASGNGAIGVGQTGGSGGSGTLSGGYSAGAGGTGANSTGPGSSGGAYGGGGGGSNGTGGGGSGSAGIVVITY